MADGSTLTVVVRYFAAARAAAGVAEEKLPVPAPATVRDVLLAAVARHGALERVLDRCSYLLDEVAVHDTGSTVSDGDVLDVLPPFAGG